MGETKDRRQKYGVIVSIIAIAVNILLFIGKFTVGKYIALSLAIYADAMNNLADAGSSVISLVSFRIAAKPADRKHPFGYARIEYVTSMLVSFLVLHTALDIFVESFQKLLSGEGETVFNAWAVAVLAFAILLKVGLFIMNRVIGKHINSSIMIANSADSLSDALSTFGVLAATVLLYFFPNLWYIDAIVGIIISVIIFISGIKIFIATKNSILGEAPEAEVTENIRKTTEKYPEALGMHDMFVHSYGPERIIVSLHIEVDGKADVFHTHDVIDNIEKELHDRYGYIATIHMDPIVTDNKQITELKAKVRTAVKSIDERLHIHDFRFVSGDTHTNLIFDIEVPFEIKLTNDRICELAEKKIKEINENYYAVITIDRE